MINYIKKIDQLVQDDYLEQLNKSGVDVPDKNKKIFTRIGGASEQCELIYSYIPSNQRILVIGLFGGRDYWWGRIKGHDVYGLDLVKYDWDQTYVANAEDVWPFSNKFFDVIIISEVMEHLFNDVNALNESHRVLKDNGKLILTVPFLDSNDAFHVRMHDEKTIEHLLNHSKYRVIHINERPGLLFKNILNKLIMGLTIISYSIFKINILKHLLKIVFDIEVILSKKKLFRRFFKVLNFIDYGATIVSVKTNESINYEEVNKKEFKNA